MTRRAVCAEPDRAPAPRQRAHGAARLARRPQPRRRVRHARRGSRPRARAGGGGGRASWTISPGSASTGTKAPIAGGPHAPYRQSERAARYDEAIDRLLDAGRAFLCACSRADVARAAQAPHEVGRGRPALSRHLPRPGRRRGARPRGARRGGRPAVRFAGDGARIDFVDEVHGAVPADGGRHRRLRPPAGRRHRRLPARGGRRRRGDGGHARRPRATTCWRSTPRQLALYRALGLAAPAFAHVPLVLTAVGRAPRQADAARGDRRPARPGASNRPRSSAPWRRRRGSCPGARRPCPPRWSRASRWPRSIGAPPSSAASSQRPRATPPRSRPSPRPDAPRIGVLAGARCGRRSSGRQFVGQLVLVQHVQPPPMAGCRDGQHVDDQIAPFDRARGDSRFVADVEVIPEGFAGPIQPVVDVVVPVGPEVPDADGARPAGRRRGRASARARSTARPRGGGRAPAPAAGSRTASHARRACA